MKKVFYVCFLFFAMGFAVSAIQIWQKQNDLRVKNSTVKEEIKNAQESLKNLASLKKAPIESVEYNYGQLDRQLRIFSHYYEFKTFWEIKGLAQEGLISAAAKDSSWPGIETLSLRLSFSGLKGDDQLITAYEFLEKVQNVNPLRISSVVQSDDHLDVELQLYGRGL